MLEEYDTSEALAGDQAAALPSQRIWQLPSDQRLMIMSKQPHDAYYAFQIPHAQLTAQRLRGTAQSWYALPAAPCSAISLLTCA